MSVLVEEGGRVEGQRGQVGQRWEVGCFSPWTSALLAASGSGARSCVDFKLQTLENSKRSRVRCVLQGRAAVEEEGFNLRLPEGHVADVAVSGCNSAMSVVQAKEAGSGCCCSFHAPAVQR